MILRSEQDDAITATVEHYCVCGCSGAAGHCLTAFKLEEIVSRQAGRPYLADSTRLDDGRLESRLLPV